MQCHRDPIECHVSIIDPLGSYARKTNRPTNGHEGSSVRYASNINPSTGSGPQHVLTAAHCVIQLPRGFALSVVRVGEFDLSKVLFLT